MSNTKHLPLGGNPVPAGDMGLGLCLQCLGELIAQDGQAPPPRFAVTMAPMFHQIVTPAGAVAGMLAAPACFEHVRQAAAPAQQPAARLLAASGSLPAGGRP